MRATQLTYGLAGFCLATIATTLPACEPSPMYCLVANGNFAAHFQPLEGDATCLEPMAQEVYFNFALNQAKDAQRGDPKSPRISFALAEPTKAWERAKDQLAKLTRYAQCPSKDSSINTAPDPAFSTKPYYSLSDFKTYIPDPQDLCHADAFSSAVIEVPALDRVPVCAEDPELSEELPAIEPLSLSYKLRSAKVLNRPASQGVFVQGVIEYSKPGCSGAYSFSAINPVVACAVPADCAGQGIAEDLAAKGIVCMGASGDPANKDGLCVLSAGN